MGFLRRDSIYRKAALVFAGVLFYAAVAAAQPKGKLLLQEQAIKAGLVYNFLKYTTWPEQAKQGLRVCLFGGEPLDGSLSSLQGKTAQQTIISISRVGDVAATAECNLIFINRGSKDRLTELLLFLKGKQVLTVSDIDKFASQGGMIELTTENNRVSLYINKSAVDRAGLNIQARILKLAKLISE